MYEQARRLVYDDSKKLSFRDLLLKDNSISIHQKSLQLLAIEIFKAKNGLVPEIISELFCFVHKPFSLHYDNILQRENNKTVDFGTKSLSSQVLKIFELIPDCLQNKSSLMTLKKKNQKLPRTNVLVNF